MNTFHVNATAAALMLAALVAFPVQGEVFVSPAGANSNPGTVDRPVATLRKALEISRKSSGELTHKIVVQPGRYFDASVSLTREDSNTIIESVGTPAMLVGGVPLTGWEKDGDRFWSAPLPSGRTWDIRLLQVNGRFCPRARFPEQGTLTHLSVFDVPWMSTTGGGWKRKPTQEELTTLRYKESDIPADMDVKGAEITVFHMWDESVSGIESVDTNSRTIRMNPPLGHPPGAFDVKTYCLWNLKEGMTQPGQWYFDRARNRVVYWPLAGENMAQLEAIVPTQRVIMELGGATNVTVRNIDFSITTVPLITGGFAAGAFDGAIQFKDANSVRLNRVRVSNVAGHGFKTVGSAQRIEIVDCEFSNCGAGGVYIDGGSNTVRQCLIHDVGLMFPSAMGINGGGDHSTLSHNEIYATPYSAVGYGPRNSIIESNLIHHCMKVLHDGAAIYVFAATNTVFRGNLVRDIIDTGGYGASSYYLDEQSRDCVVEGNVSINVARPSHNHMATNNVIRNNVFITDGDMKITFPRSTGFKMEGNVLYASGSITVEGVNNVKTWSGNLFYSGKGSIQGTTLSDYSETGRLPGVLGDTQVGDPLFVNGGKLDFRYKPESPALKLGLKALDVSSAGRQK